MDGKNVLVAVLVAVVAILAKGTWDRSSAANPAASSTGMATGAAPGAAAKPAAGAKGQPAGAANPAAEPAACDMKPACAADGDMFCRLGRDFPELPAAHPAGAPASQSGKPPMRVLLASVPSPVDPSLVTDFDRAIEAIERAVQSQRFVPQREWFPWRENVAGKPGWLLFRRDREVQQPTGGEVSLELLLVLLVTERPSSGIDRAELHGALAQLDEIAKRAHTPGDEKLLFLGPTYSGAAESLVQQARDWCAACGKEFCPAHALVALSGTATRRRTKAVVEGLKGVFRDSTFAATVLPDDLLVAGMHRFLKERLEIPLDETADLAETSTDYGNAVASDDRPRPESGLKIALPLHVSLLAADKADGKTEPPPLAKSNALELEGTFSTLSRNGINYVGILTTATRDKVFLVSRLRASAPDLRVHVYESSVDLLDRSQRKSLDGLMVVSSYPVFAETQLWHRPAAPLVQFPSDAAEGIYNAVLGLLASFDEELRGSLPSRLLDYVSPFCREVPGPSVWVSVSITGQLWPLAVYGQELAANPAAVDCKQARAIDPYLFNPPEAAAAAGQPAVEKPKLPPLPVHASFLTLIGAVVVLILLVGNGIGFSMWRPDAAWRALVVSNDPKGTASDKAKGLRSALPAQGPRHNVAMLGLWALAITAVVMGKVLDLPSALPATEKSDFVVRALAHLLIGGAFVLVATACVLSVRRSVEAEERADTTPEEKKDRRERQVSAAIQVVMCGVMLLAIALLPLDGIRDPDGHAYFFFVRATDPGVGLTPTIPLFMVGITVYGAALLRLIVVRRAERLAAEAKMWEPQAASPQSFSACAEAMKRFADAAAGSLLPACLVGTIGGSAVLYLTPIRLGSLEGRGFDAGCSVCFALIFTLTLAAAWRAHSLWFRLRDFTRALAIHPAVSALTRLPSSVAERFRSPVPGQVSNQQIAVALKMTLHALGPAATDTSLPHLLRALDGRWFPLNAAKAAVTATAGAPASSPDPHQERREKLQEDVLALHMASALGLMCDATRTMLFIATGTGLAALLGSTLYPFQPAASLTAAGLISVGLVVLVALRVLIGIERDRVLSDVAGTTPGKVTPSLGLFTRLVGYVVVPLGGLIGSRLQDSGTVIEALKNLTNALNR